jgi:hypothetical protein
MGNSDEDADRYGSGPWCIYLPEPESKFVAGRTQLRKFDINALLFVVKGTEDGDLLFEAQGASPGTTVYD